VELFFVLSGFLITGILLDTRSSQNYFTSFYGRRFLRIFPAYYANLLALFVIAPQLVSFLPSGLQETWQKAVPYQGWFWSYLANWMYAWQGTFNNVPGAYFWSLAVEEQFYLVWPLVVYGLDRRKLGRYCLLLLLAVILLRLGLLGCKVPGVSVYAATITHLDGLVAGALLAVLVRALPLDRLPLPALRYSAILCIVVLASYGFWRSSFEFWDIRIAGVGLTLLTVIFSYLLLATISAPPSSFLPRLLASRFFRSFGRYSYAIYLIHVPLGRVLEKVIFSSGPFAGQLFLVGLLLFLLVGTATSWLLGLVSWHLFEKHFLKLKRWFPYPDGCTQGDKLPGPHRTISASDRYTSIQSRSCESAERSSSRGLTISATSRALT
jgi:peptidoglycan/LPS O-acetylase OafA/YrhL